METRSIRNWGKHPYVRAFALLLLTVLVLVAVSALSWCVGCNCSCKDSCDTTQVKSLGRGDNLPEAHIQSDTGWTDTVAPGAQIAHRLTGFVSGADPGDLSLKYTPPAGVTDIQFTGRPYDERTPDGSYVWRMVDTLLDPGGGWKSEPIIATFSAPALPPGQTTMKTTATLTVTHPDGETHTASMVNTVSNGPAVARAASADAPHGWEAAPAQVGAQAADYYLWQVSTWHDIHDQPLTTDICQEWADLLNHTDAFIGVQFPLLGATPPYTGAYSLPIAFYGNYDPAVKLVDLSHWPFTAVMTVPLEYKPEFHTFLTSELPWSDNKRWFALGVDTGSPIVCPPGLNLGADDWNIETRAWLDFGGALGAGAESVLPVYYCYRGKELPAIPGVASQVLGPFAANYQGWGITCLGPHLLRLTEAGVANPPFVFTGVQAAAALPTERVTYTLTVANLGNTTVNLNLAATSTAGETWDFYGLNDPPTPLAMPVQVKGQSSGVFYKEFRVAGNVPAGAAAGPHTVQITATDAAQPTRKAETTALLWVGDWEPPPPFKVYLPVVVRR